MFYAAPTQQRPNYRWKLILVEDDFTLYDCRYRGRVIHSALVTKETTPRANIDSLKDLCNKLQLLCPMEKISHEEDGVEMMTLLYRPFKTISAYMCEAGISFEEPTFVIAMWRIISGLNNLHSEKFDPRLPIVLRPSTTPSGMRLREEEREATTTNVMVIQDDGVGGLLYISSGGEIEVTRTNTMCQTDFVHVERAISTMVEQLLLKSTLLRSFELESLLACMTLAKSKPQRQRLVLHPYFISPKNIMDTYIEKMFSSAWACKSFMDALSAKKLDKRVAKKIKETEYEELKKLMKAHKEGFHNYYHLLHFARDCVHHIQRDWTAVRQDSDDPISVLLAQPEKFLEEIDGWLSGFMHKIFEVSYGRYVTWKVDILDDDTV